MGVRNRVVYAASKGAVVGLTLAMAADNIASGVRVNAVAPGTADTPWVARLLDAADDPEAEAAALRARQPMGRLVTAAEVAHAVCYLASPASASTTGTILSVDGGMATSPGLIRERTEGSESRYAGLPITFSPTAKRAGNDDRRATGATQSRPVAITLREPPQGTHVRSVSLARPATSKPTSSYDDSPAHAADPGVP